MAYKEISLDTFSAKASLNQAEQGAAAQPISATTSQAGPSPKAAEQDQAFRSWVQGRKKSKTSSIRGLLRKNGPIFSIFMFIIGSAGIMAGSQALMPFALVENAIGNFNSMRVAFNTRSSYFERFSMNPKRNHSLTKKTLFQGEKFKISKRLGKRLSKHNIDFIEDLGADGKINARYLIYTDRDGKKIPVVAKSEDIGNIDNASLAEIGTSTDQAKTLDDLLIEDPNFEIDHDRGTRTTAGNIAGWFTKLAEFFHIRIGNPRARHSQTKKDASDEEVQKGAKREGLDEDRSGKKSISELEELVEKKDEHGDIVTSKEKVRDTDNEYATGDPIDSLDDSVSSAEIRTGLTGSTKDKSRTVENVKSGLASIAKKSMVRAMSMTCMVFKAIGAINLTIAAINVAKILNYTTGLLEAIQKTQAGEGGAELAYYMKGLTTPGNSKYVDNNGQEHEKYGTAMGSRAIASIFDGAQVSPSDPMAQKFNIERISNASHAPAIRDIGSKDDFKDERTTNDIDIFGSLAGASGAVMNGIAAFKACNTVKIIGNIVGIALEGLSMASLGVGKVFKNMMQGFGNKMLFAGAMQIVMTIVKGVIIPYISNLFISDFITKMAGEDTGYVTSSGLNMYMGRNYQAGGGTPGSKDVVIAHRREHQAIIAKDAKHDRATKSPFDLSSRHTFFGSIVNTLLPLSFSLTSAFGVVSALGGLASSSLVSLFPAVKAATDESEFASSLNDNCPYLQSVGAVGDAYCNPYYVTDKKTLSWDPSDVIKKIQDKSASFKRSNTNDKKLETDDNKNVVIREDSKLAKFIIACTSRESQYGIVDTKIQSFVSRKTSTDNAVADGAISTALGFIPFVNNALGLLDDAGEAVNLKWNSGAACINDGGEEGKPVENGKNPYWAENRNYQRFVEDQNLLEASGALPNNKNAVAVFLENHYKKHPIDNSYEGMIARYSGLSKEQTIANLNLIDYVNFVAKYDPSGLSPLPRSETEIISLADQVPDAIIADHQGVPVVQHVMYNDTRSRSHAA